MKPNILIATQISEGKEYCLRFIRDELKKLAASDGVSGVLCTIVDNAKVEVDEFRKSLDLGDSVVVEKLDLDGRAFAGKPSPTRIGTVREHQRQKFLRSKTNYSHLYFHDCDIIHPDPSEVIPKLLSMDTHIAANAYYIKSFEYPIFVVLTEDPSEDVYKK